MYLEVLLKIVQWPQWKWETHKKHLEFNQKSTSESSSIITSWTVSSWSLLLTPLYHIDPQVSLVEPHQHTNRALKHCQLCPIHSSRDLALCEHFQEPSSRYLTVNYIFWYVWRVTWNRDAVRQCLLSLHYLINCLHHSFSWASCTEGYKYFSATFWHMSSCWNEQLMHRGRFICLKIMKKSYGQGNIFK